MLSVSRLKRKQNSVLPQMKTEFCFAPNLFRAKKTKSKNRIEKQNKKQNIKQNRKTLFKNRIEKQNRKTEYKTESKNIIKNRIEKQNIKQSKKTEFCY